MRIKISSNRKYVIYTIFLLIGIIFIFRLFYIQIIDESYKTSADNNSRRDITIYPARGLIYDRYGKLIVYNEATYDLMVIPRQVKKDINVSELCHLVGISKDDYKSSKIF